MHLQEKKKGDDARRSLTNGHVAVRINKPLYTYTTVQYLLW